VSDRKPYPPRRFVQRKEAGSGLGRTCPWQNGSMSPPKHLARADIPREQRRHCQTHPMLRRNQLMWPLAAVMALSACGGGKSVSSKKPTTTVAEVTSTTAADGASSGNDSSSSGANGAAVVVEPIAGAGGTSFSLTASSFAPGETVTFQITLPNGKTFTGSPHPIGPSGTVIANYRASSPAGAYAVKAVGSKGSTATGSFKLTSSVATTTTAKGVTSTTGRAGTTTTVHTTATSPGHGAGTTTTTDSSGTTATTGHTTSTVAHTTTTVSPTTTAG
jgi:hypothetical protein